MFGCDYDNDDNAFARAAGKTIARIMGATIDSEEVTIEFTDGSVLLMHHHDDCCEFVRVVDVTGEPEDLHGATVYVADEATSLEHQDADNSSTWTFYRIQTPAADLTIRWLGTSNGYYSERVSCHLIPATLPNQRSKK